MNTRGLRLNNPGNIRIVHGTKWRGTSPVSSDREFVTFASPEFGIRAICRIMRSYSTEGFNTLRRIINRWAPDVENNVQAYLDDVCGRCGVLPDAPVDIESLMPMIIKAIIYHENGSCPFSDQQIDAGISMASDRAALNA